MHALRAFVTALALASAPLAVLPTIATAQESIEVSEFYEALEQHGRWIEHAQYGYVWSPDVEEGWRPYTRGRWAFTEEHGWVWESDEPFGWAVFHYGRWFLDDEHGWLWVPGTEWGPAWVAWRHSDAHVGWAPLPPEAEWRDDGLAFTATYYDAPRFSPAWCFVPVAALTSYAVWRHVAPPRRNSLYLRSTTWVPRSHSRGRFGVYNAGFDRRRYEVVTRRPLTPVRIEISDRRPDRNAIPRSGAGAGSIRVFRPRVSGVVGAAPPPRLVPRDELRRRRDGDRRDGGRFGGRPLDPGARPGSEPRGRPEPSAVRPPLARPDRLPPAAGAPPRAAQPPLASPPLAIPGRALPPGSFDGDRRRQRPDDPQLRRQPPARTVQPPVPTTRPPVAQPPSTAQPRVLNQPGPPRAFQPGGEQRGRGPSGPAAGQAGPPGARAIPQGQGGRGGQDQRSRRDPRQQQQDGQPPPPTVIPR